MSRQGTKTGARASGRERPTEERAGRWLLVVVGVLLLAVVMPVVLRGGLLADEYVICMRPIREGGYGAYLDAIWRDTGVVRPARFIELFLISKTCTTVPFGFTILVPLSLKFVTAFLLFGLLRDLGLRAPWPAIGTAIWLLEPVGTEAELWPAALHVLFGLAFALAALRSYQRGSTLWGGIATLGAALSVEQVIFAFPLAVWLLTPAQHRRRSTTVALAVMATVLVAYALWPGDNPRQAVPLIERLQYVFDQPEWYLFFPAAGIGLYSGALAFLWAFPFSVVVVGLGAAGGLWFAPFLRDHSEGGLDRKTLGRLALATGALVVLANLPLIVTEVGYSARTFTPTWLVLAGAAALIGARVSSRRARVLAVLGGLFAAFALLSLALSVSVRVRTDRFDEAAAHWIAERTQDGDVVAVCDVGRTAVDPAPLGAFHLHALHTPSGEWIEYLTGRVVDFRRSGERYWGSRCPDLTGADLVARFPDLVAAVSGGADA